MLAMLAGSFLACGTEGRAAVDAATPAESEAFGVSADLSLAAIVNLETGALGESAGTAPPDFDDSASVTDIDVAAPILVLGDAAAIDGSISSSASSHFEGGTGILTTRSDVTVENLDLRVLDLLAAPASLRISASTVEADVLLTGDAQGFSASGGTVLTGLGIEIAGVAVSLADLGLPANPPPNSSVDLSVAGLAGVTLHFNEESIAGNAAEGFLVSRNALRIVITGLNVNLGLLGGGLQVLSGEIVVGHAEASQVSDSDGDGTSDLLDGDADGDGIPSATEIANAAPGGDSDGDGVPDHLDLDSDDDAINDVVEAGGEDDNGDGRQDAFGDGTNDADGDGIVDSADEDEGGDDLPVPDSDGDGTFDYLDLDSDNDSLGDLVESGQTAGDADGNGVADGPDSDGDGIPDGADGLVGFGDASGAGGYPDADGNGIIDAAQADSDSDGTPDIAGTGNEGFDGNGDGQVDVTADLDGDGIDDALDFQQPQFGGIADPFGDFDADGIPNGSEGGLVRDTDQDGVPDARDGDSDGDGIPDLADGPADLDGDNLGNYVDLDSDGDGINDVSEGGGDDADGDGLQDATGDGSDDADGDGIVDAADPDEGGTPLPLPDTDGDLARDFVDLDSDNDTLSDVLETGLGAFDIDQDGITDGTDPDGDGITSGVDGSSVWGDAGTPPRDTDGDGTPDHLDTTSAGGSIPDIQSTANGDQDTDGDGMVDPPLADIDSDGVPDVVDDDTSIFGGSGTPKVLTSTWIDDHFPPGSGGSGPDFEWDGDPDGDGATNLHEYFGGSDPHDEGDVPGFTVLIQDDGGDPYLTLIVDRDPTAYAFGVVEVSTDLVVWSSDPGDVLLLGASANQLIARATKAVGPEAPRVFIRLRIVAP